jgi:hypothetical protein
MPDHSGNIFPHFENIIPFSFHGTFSQVLKQPDTLQ